MNDRLLRALRREPVDRTPVWFMRQAGRYLPEYRELRGDRDILDAVRDPELAVELTLQPLRRMPVDAAIVFSDIMVPLAAVGVPVRIAPGVGPLVDEPVRDEASVSRLRHLEPEIDEPYTLESIRLLRKELGVPLIGFAGGPFTLASYLIEGGPSRDHARTKAMMLGSPNAWASLMDALSAIARAHLLAQVEAGAQVVQLFDSWAGALTVDDYVASVQPWAGRVLTDLPFLSIHFGVGTGELLAAMGEAGADVVGVDFRVSLTDALERTGGRYALQGNLDPALLFAPWEAIESHVRAIVDEGRAAPGHVFNLGHGVLPETDPDVLTRVVGLVHEISAH